MKDELRVGTRGSPLALAQTEEALVRLRRLHPHVAFEIVEVQTHGDEGHHDDRGTALDGKRAFTKRIEEALLDGRVDFAVHSLKDVPTDLDAALRIAAVPARADPRDVCVTLNGLSMEDLPGGSRVGTGSLRRRAQLLAAWPALKVVDLHGNVGTRLRRLDARDFDAVVVAAAGLNRLGLQERRPEFLSPDVLTPAPGQGALALECRADDTTTCALLQSVDDPRTRLATDAERALSAHLGGGCNVPFGALAAFEDGGLRLRAVVASPDGRRIVRATTQASADAWRATVDSVASHLLEGGADEILKEAA